MRQSFVFVLTLFVSVFVPWCPLGVAAEFKVIPTSDNSCSAPQGIPTEDIICQPNTTASLDYAKSIAWQFAPKAYFHPLERYHLQNFETFYNASMMFLTDFKTYPNSSYDYVVANDTNMGLLGPKTFITLLNSTSLTQSELQGVLSGQPFDEYNRSTAKIYYTVTDYGDSLWLYNYNFFYSWNGCSNQAVALTFNGSVDTQNYIMCPEGVHEGDLERVSMLVCKSDLKIKRIAYSQHAWTEVRDCQVEGQCPMDPDTGRPVTHVALEGHGNYPENDGFHVYFYLGGGRTGFNNITLPNIGGIYVGDRTGEDPSKVFVPTPDNIVYIPPAWEIEQGLAAGDMQEWRWAVYPGNWGAPLADQPTVLYCPADNGSIVECDKNSTTISVIYDIINVAGLGKTINSQEGVTVKNVTNTSLVGYPDITGPLMRPFSYQWIADKEAPILSYPVTTLVCPNSVNSVEAFPNFNVLHADANTIVQYLVGITVGTLLFSLVLVIILSLPIIMDKSAKVQQLVMVQAGKIWQAGKKTAAYPIDTMRGNASSQSGAHPTVDIEAVDKQNGKEEDAPVTRDDLAAASFASSGVTEYMDINFQMDEKATLRILIWGIFATCLFIAGIVLLSIGVNAMFTNSILTLAADRLGQGSIVNALQWLTLGVMIFIIASDVIMFFFIFALNPREMRIWRYRVKNYLGGHKFLTDRSFELLVTFIGILVLIIALAAVLFALGLVISLIQLTARIGCNTIFDRDVFGMSVQSLCIQVPTLGIDVCGWQALQTCSDATTMHVRLIMVGAMMLLWTNTLWLVILVGALEIYKAHKVKLKRAREYMEISHHESQSEHPVDDTNDDPSYSGDMPK